MKNLRSLLLLSVMIMTAMIVNGEGNRGDFGTRNLTNSIIPEPQYIYVAGSTGLTISAGSVILAPGCEEINSADFLNSYLKKHYGFSLKIVNTHAELEALLKSKTSADVISVIDLSIKPLGTLIEATKLGYTADDFKKEGAYYLKTSNNTATLVGANPQGLFYAVQSLIQLLPVQLSNSHSKHKLNVIDAEIADFPRFEYRGMHLDVVRHIYSVDYVKQYIDYLALHKMNYFHWHLTDDQGWRMESKSHPKLNEIGSWRAGTIIGIFPGTGVDSTRYGGYYTIEQMKDVIEYAAQRYIEIVPEIDVPGHSMAIIATYPQFSTTPNIPKEPAITWGIYNRQNNVLAPSEAVFEFLSDVFNELMDVFPGQYIHIGADECAKKWWEESAETQAFMKAYGLKDENELQKYFAKRIADIIHARGRKFIGWDEMLDDGLVEGAVVMSWRNAENGIKAAELGHKAIMTPIKYSYFNVAQKRNEDTLCHRSWYAPVDSVYLFEPVPASVPAEVAANVLGGQGCMWTEYFPHRQRLEYGIFPRFSALAEVYWTLPSRKSWPKFQLKLVDQFDRYDLWGANYATEFFRSSGLSRNKR
jgi:hexosaminidase